MQQVAATTPILKLPGLGLLPKALLFLLLLLVLPHFPQAQPPAAGDAAASLILSKACELVQLLLVGLVISYGLFSRKNGQLALAEPISTPLVPNRRPVPDNNDGMHGCLVFYDDDVDDGVTGQLLDDNGDEGISEMSIRSWSSVHKPNESVAVVASRDDQALYLPVRSLRPRSVQPAQDHAKVKIDADEYSIINHRPASSSSSERRRSNNLDMPQGAADAASGSVLPSPIPWRSRSGSSFDARDELQEHPKMNRPSPKTLSPAASFSADQAIAADYHAAVKVPVDQSSVKRRSSAAPVPVPPPPPPPASLQPISTGLQAGRAQLQPALLMTDQRRKQQPGNSKSFKDELKDVSMKAATAAVSTADANYRRSRSMISSPAASSSNASPVGRAASRMASMKEPAAPYSQDVAAAQERRALHHEELERQRQRQSDDSMLQSVQGAEAGGGGMSMATAGADEGAAGGAGGGTMQAGGMADDEEVDRKADEFIAKFREQIRLQRIEMIKQAAEQRAARRR